MEDPSKSQQPQPPEEEFTADYANNVFFSPTVWDLKIVFGELSAVKQAVDWHTSITLPWAQAKLMAYYLEVNIAAREMREGRIKIPEMMLPPEPPPPPPESEKDYAASKALFDMIKERRTKFIENQK